ncbi:aldolase/citrate lyase family protein [Phytohabitans aurantiacus]|uniref:Phosphoenolpyruvate-protein phosphotransferase n=1 Tax=Phytohabitans aurantiacus TaxID=3016789 RepID=A0ABQ5R4E2_9ACTN|nr:putative PEP-binding protein [Phytohabitans aurantiacus]GLI01213.1 phosphoenolpyruvate-protein phosphotransferase [Phytohabitans aurantiacus]
MRYRGTAGAPGVGIGHIWHVIRASLKSLERLEGRPDHDVIAAFDAVAARLRARASALRNDGLDEPADIAETMALIADDPDLRDAAVTSARAGQAADMAVRVAVEHYASMLAALPDPTLAARATDVRQIGRRAVAVLRGDVASTVEGPLVLVGRELGADDLIDAPDEVAGAVSLLGGPNAHVAIVARALGVPLVFGLELEAPDGALAIVDGASVVVAPTGEEQHAARVAMRAAAERRVTLASERELPAVTRGGRAITLLANVSTPDDAIAAVAAGAAGAGLVRTELPFLATTSWPTEADHMAALRPVLAPLVGRVATVRTLDFGGDKVPPFLSGQSLRGIALSLSAPGALAAQLRAIRLAGAGTSLRVMLPLVESAEQVHECRALLASPSTPLGAMIESPPAVAAVDEIAEAADFLSIGSNDLSASLLGLDRRDPRLNPGSAAEPVVLQAIAAVVAAGERHGKPVSLCGDAAADPSVVPLLIGLGCTVLSVAPSALDEVRTLVRNRL